MNGWAMPSIMSKFGATIGIIFPCVRITLVNMTYILLFCSNDDLISDLLPRALKMNDLVMGKGAGLGDSVQDSKVVGRLTHSGAAKVLFSFSKNIACKWELRSF